MFTKFYFFFQLFILSLSATEGLPLYYWHENKAINFGDHISLKLVERIVGSTIEVYEKKPVVFGKKLLAIGSILYFARDGDIVWGTGLNGKTPLKSDYKFEFLDVRSVRGPLTRAFLKDTFDINSPEIYGDPALLFPYFFPDFKKKPIPEYDYIVIPHFSEEKLFPKSIFKNIVYPTEPWNEVISKILASKFVISSSLHGLIIAEAYGIPARMLRVTENEKILKYIDYYSGTNRFHFEFATSIEEALEMGGEVPFQCDLQAIYNAFPFELWPSASFQNPDFSLKAPL